MLALTALAQSPRLESPASSFIIWPVRRVKTIGFLILAAVLAGLGLYLFRQQQEPRYKGRKLSYWLDRFDHDSCFVNGQGRHLPAWDEDVEALRAMGTNAIPYLVQQLQKRDSRWKRFVLERARRWYGPIPVANRGTINFFKSDADKRRDALEVLSVLGERAAPAVPQLVEMLQSPDDNASSQAARTLEHIG